MDYEQLRSKVQARHDQNSAAINAAYRGFIDVMNASVTGYVKAKGLEFPQGEAAAVFRDGQEHYNRMLDTARYGAKDLDKILKIELVSALWDSRTGAAEEKILMSIFGEEAGMYVQSYPVRLSTLIDNLHLLVASWYGIDVEGEFSIKAAVGMKLAEHNRDLKYYLQRQVVKKGFTRLRTAQVHGAPDFKEWMEFGSETELPQLSLVFFDAEPSQTARAFDYLFPFYERTLSSASRAMELLLA